MAFERIAGWLHEELGFAYPRSIPEDRAVVTSGVWGLALVVEGASSPPVAQPSAVHEWGFAGYS
jgi:hypothetical protein